MKTTETTQLIKPVNGINNTANETNIPKGFLRAALNVDSDNTGNISRRKGYTKIHSGEKCHSLYRGYFVDNKQIKYIDKNNNIYDVPGIYVNDELSYCELNTDVIFTDGLNNGRITNTLDYEPLSIENQAFQPNTTPSTGALSGGAYQYAVCNISGLGTLSGTGKAKVIELNHGVGIKFTNFDFTYYDAALFVSEPNGTVLYMRAIIPNGTEEFILGTLGDKGISLDTQFLFPLPPGHIVRQYRGSLYVANDNVLWFSKARRYGLHKPNEDFFQFASRITVVEPVENGIFIVADATYFLSGNNPEDMRLINVSKDTAIEGTGLKVSGKNFNFDTKQQLAFWVSNKGMVVGFPDGDITSMTEDNIAIDTNFIKGSSMYREVDGKKQILTALNGGGESSTFTSTDTLTSTIIRNGVEITE